MPTRFLVALTALVITASNAPASAQVHYHEDRNPWNQRANSGPDAEVDGWYYNLGITGLRVELVADAPRHLLVKHVFAGTPADKKVRVGDYVIAAGSARFETPHRNGYGMEVFGPKGPIEDFAAALEFAQSKEGKGRLPLVLRRGEKEVEVELNIGREYGTFAETFPAECDKSAKILDELLDRLLEYQREDGSFGLEPRDTFAPLALLASGKKKHLAAVERNVRFHAKNTYRNQEREGLLNWRYMSAAIVMSEYYLATGAKWVLPELQEVYDFLITSQYTDLSQVNPRVKETHPHDWPNGAMEQHGGWGHNPGFEGYGPIAMLTGQGALAFALMSRCGIEVDRVRHDAAYAFLERGSGANGYVWYGDEPGGGADDWADMGRTGAAGVAYLLAPYDEPRYRERALDHARVIGLHPESFPDTHGSPILGMGYAALAANADPDAFRRLMAANRWWFALAQCADGSFYYQPNRDNAGYGSDSRESATAVTAFVLSIPKRNLHVFGKPLAK